MFPSSFSIPICSLYFYVGFPGGSASKNLPAMREIWVWSLGWEDPLGQGTATHSSNSGLESSMDYIVHGVTKHWKWGSNFHTHIAWMSFINSLFAIFCKVLPYALFPERYSYLRKCAYRLSAFGFWFDSWVGKSAGEKIGYPLQYSSLENSMDCIVDGVTKSWTRLRDFHFHFTSISTLKVMSILDHCFLD